MTITVYRDKKKELRWRAVERNGHIRAVPGEGYKRAETVVKALNSVFGFKEGDVVPWATRVIFRGDKWFTVKWPAGPRKKGAR